MRLGNKQRNTGTTPGFAPRILQRRISGASVRICRHLRTPQRGSCRPLMSTSVTILIVCCQTALRFAARITELTTKLEIVPPGPCRSAACLPACLPASPSNHNSLLIEVNALKRSCARKQAMLIFIVNSLPNHHNIQAPAFCLLPDISFHA